MKKIISILASLAMMVSVSATVFASASDNPVVGVNVTQSGNAYVASVNLSNLETLSRTEGDWGATGKVLNQFTVTLKVEGATKVVLDKTTVLSSIDVFTLIDNKDGTYQVNFAPSSTANWYPKVENTGITSINNALGIKIQADSTPTVTVVDWKVAYTTLQDDEQKSNSSKYSVDVEKEYSGDNGYVWGISFMSAGTLDSLTATFKDADNNTKTMTATDLSNYKNYQGSGKLTFDIGLQTTRTITSADFDVVSGTGTSSYGTGCGVWTN